MGWNTDLQQRIEILAKSLKSQQKTLACAESCTGGWLAKAITDKAGASSWFDRGFVTYSNQAKIDMLAVSADIITGQGAVSQAVVEAMATGALQNSLADFSVAITGIAGPDGGSVDKPVGTIWFAWAGRYKSVVSSKQCFAGDRKRVRRYAVNYVLEGLLSYI